MPGQDRGSVIRNAANGRREERDNGEDETEELEAGVSLPVSVVLMPIATRGVLYPLNCRVESSEDSVTTDEELSLGSC